MPTTNSWGNQTLSAPVKFNGASFAVSDDSANCSITIGYSAGGNKTTTIGSPNGGGRSDIIGGAGGLRLYTAGGGLIALEGSKTTNVPSINIKPGSTICMSFSGTGIMTSALQPRFSAFKSSATNNVTGSGTEYQVICDTENFDITTNYNNTTGNFVAPATGNYLFSAAISVTGCTIATQGLIKIQTTGSTTKTYTNSVYRAASADSMGLEITCLAYMTAADVAKLYVTVSGEAADTADIDGSASVDLTRFQAYLLG